MSVGPAPSRARLLELLVERSFQRRTVTLSAGGTSSFYLDCKQTALHAEGAWHLGHLLYAAVCELAAAAGRQCIGVGGMTLGADPLATATSLASVRTGRNLHAFIVRKEKKGHGTGAYVEGRANLPDGSPVILLEDVVTTGNATLMALERVLEERLVPVGIVAIVDRLAGGVAALQRTGLPVTCLYTADDFPLDSTP